MLIKLLKAVWLRLRCVLPNQPSEPYMESKIPLPTDNIFKFYALFALFVFIFSIGAILYVSQTHNDRVLVLYPELEALRQAKDLPPRDQTRRDLLEQLLEAQKSDLKFYKSALGFLSGISFWGMMFGFWRWHREVQPRIDEANRIQLEIAKLQLAKLQAEIAPREGDVDRV